MAIPIFTVDAFADAPFSGNPAGVCLLDQKVEAEWMQNVAREMNLAETAFVSPRPDGFDLRWFTPTIEMKLCGHATLASAHVLWETGTLTARTPARFETLSGTLICEQRAAGIEMDFPAQPVTAAQAPEGLLESLGGIKPVHVARNDMDYLLEVESEDVVRSVTPDFGRLERVEARGVIVTSRPGATPGATKNVDFVSRFFAPRAGVPEDPVTGSAHCALAPYWSAKLGKSAMVGRQLSARGGTVQVAVDGDRVKLGGTAFTVLKGVLLQPVAV